MPYQSYKLLFLLFHSLSTILDLTGQLILFQDVIFVAKVVDHCLILSLIRHSVQGLTFWIIYIFVCLGNHFLLCNLINNHWKLGDRIFNPLILITIYSIFMITISIFQLFLFPIVIFCWRMLYRSFWQLCYFIYKCCLSIIRNKCDYKLFTMSFEYDWRNPHFSV